MTIFPNRDRFLGSKNLRNSDALREHEYVQPFVAAATKGCTEGALWIFRVLDRICNRWLPLAANSITCWAPGSQHPTLRFRRDGVMQDEGGPRIIRLPCATSDYLPTILDFAGIDVDPKLTFDGMSLRPLVAGEINDRPVPIGFEFGDMAVWLDNRFKLVAMLKGGESARDLNKAAGRWMLFDIPDDPGEERDLSAKRPARVRQMRAALEAWRESCWERIRQL